MKNMLFLGLVSVLLFGCEGGKNHENYPEGTPYWECRHEGCKNYKLYNQSDPCDQRCVCPVCNYGLTRIANPIQVTI